MGETDTISRQAALDALRSCQTYLFDAKDPDKKIELRSAELVIEGLPPVQPKKRKQGRWLINSDGYYPYCSECRKEPKSGDMTDFCPSCGADMRKDEEHDE